MMKALVLVDIQNDFVEGGALAVRGGRQVVPVANELMSQFELVVATQDWHPADHGSFASQHDGINVGDLFELDGVRQIAWPDHCVQGTSGAEFVSSLNLDGVHEVVRKGTRREIDSYSGFFDNDRRHATGLAEFLAMRGVDEIYVMGLATDYCVKFTALDAAELGLRVNLVEEGCRGVELESGDIARAIDGMKQAGVEVVSKAQVVA